MKKIIITVLITVALCGVGFLIGENMAPQDPSPDDVPSSSSLSPQEKQLAISQRQLAVSLDNLLKRQHGAKVGAITGGGIGLIAGLVVATLASRKKPTTT